MSQRKNVQALANCMSMLLTQYVQIHVHTFSVTYGSNISKKEMQEKVLHCLRSCSLVNVVADPAQIAT